MSFLCGADNLRLRRLAGGNIISHAPIFAPTGDLLFLISECSVHVYSTSTGLYVRELEGGGEHKLVSIELDLFNEDTLIACAENGEMFYWKWQTGQLKRKLQLKIIDSKVTSCNQMNWCGDSESANVVLLCKGTEDKMRLVIYETTHGNYVKVPLNLSLNEKPAIAAVHTKAFKIICIAQDFRIYFIDYTTWKWIGLTNGLKIPFTCLKWHPEEEMIATGDKLGRIFLWREFWDHTTVKNRLYHWHATPVTSIAFTQSGSGFYSSGLEAVVVIWNVSRPEIRKFLPHLTCIVRHIAVSNANVHIAISTLDNGVQIYGNDYNVKCILQEFTYIMEDETIENYRYPVGLRINPLSNALVLNGRIGQLQFYSAHTRSFLYNVDIVGQNILTKEQGKILYNIDVVKAAFNIDWMATGEVFNDEEHFPELRLKFWKFIEQSQSFALNTSIELPHEGGFNAIEFSSAHQVENLLCATVGQDNVIKVWALEDTDNIYKKGKVWFCVAQTNYKKMPIESVSFSHDGSLLAAGCGNTLCIFKAYTLKLKATLNTSPGIDGSISKAEIRLAVNKNQTKDRNNVLKLFSTALEGSDDDAFIKKLKQQNITKKTKIREETHSYQLDDQEKSKLFKHIMSTHQLNLFQQLLLLQRLGIQCKVSEPWQQKMLNYLRETVHNDSLTERIDSLNARVRRLNVRHRFKAKCRLQNRMNRRKIKGSNNDNLASILSVLGLKEITPNSKRIEDVDTQNEKMDIDNEDAQLCSTAQEDLESCITTASITHVQFASNEYGHLVIVCTETRVLVWNLLTLRLENVLKLSTKHLAFDPLTNLAAVFTKNNELHIFQPNVPMPIYQRSQLPKIHGAVWLPCRYPKSSSIHVDWQSQSQLYFLTDSQEIMYLHDPKGRDNVESHSIAFKNPIKTVGLQYSTFGTFATQQISDKQNNKKLESGPLIVGSAGKTAVKVLVDMSTHTMPPISLVCNDFLKALVRPVNSDSESASTLSNSTRKSNKIRKNINGAMNGTLNGSCAHESSEEDSDDDNDDDTVTSTRMVNGGIPNIKTKNTAEKLSAEAYRKNIIAKAEQIIDLHEKTKIKEQNQRLSIESQLKKIAESNLGLEF